MPRGQLINKDALQYIPQTFGAKGFNYDAAVRKSLDAQFAKRALGKAKGSGPLNAARAARAAGVV